LGPGGLVEGAGDVITNLQNGNFVGAALGGFRTANNFKNTNLKTVATAELAQLGKNILSGRNPQSSVFFPTGREPPAPGCGDSGAAGNGPAGTPAAGTVFDGTG
jgi:hypothetical protein